ncbi:hypothetical protein [Amycolatopsis sp. lyj-109]|uniref:hypothetical protein n=1 Tax=Amycolatopsis sp. lyj-109 TaxID=2789287 RepID=UPI003979F5BD
MASTKGTLISTSTSDSSLFSHPVAEEPRPEAVTAPQENRYGNLFLQPVAPASTRAHDRSGRHTR